MSPPEVIARVRAVGIEGTIKTIDRVGRINASADSKFVNPVFRDFAWSITESGYTEHNLISPHVLAAAINTMNIFLGYQMSQDSLAEGIREGEIPHEIHDENTPLERKKELIRGGHRTQPDGKGGEMIVSFEADDNPSWARIATEIIIQKISKTDPERAIFQLREWAPVLERARIHNMDYVSRGDGLIQTVERRGSTGIFRTWRDGRGAFRDRNGEIPQPSFTFFSNNVLEIRALEADANLGLILENDDLVEASLKRREQLMEVVHDNFWMDNEQCYSPLIDGQGKKLELVTNESVLGLFAGALYPEFAARVADRFTRDDFLTDFGTRLVSLSEPEHLEDELEYYQRQQAVWLQMDTSFALGCHRYGLEATKGVLIDRVVNYVSQLGTREMTLVDREGRPYDYTEDGKPVASRIQAFAAHGVVGVTSPGIISTQSRSYEPVYI